MRLSGIGTNNSLFNVGVINKQLSRANENNNAQNNLSIQQGNRDSVFISG